VAYVAFLGSILTLIKKSTVEYSFNFLKVEFTICLAESRDGSVSIMTRMTYTAFDFQVEKGVSSSQRNSTPAL
jgi:hypothetical protein